MTNALFTATTETVTVTPDVVPAVFSMPVVDASNRDTMITVTQHPVWITFGATTTVGPNASGGLLVQPNMPLLLTVNAAVVAATTSNPAVNGTTVATVAAAATKFAAVTARRGATVTVTRGSSAATTIF